MIDNDANNVDSNSDDEDDDGYCETIFSATSTHYLFMAALCNRGALYFCPVVSFFFFYLLFFPRLISAAVDWMSAILLHMAWP